MIFIAPEALALKVEFALAVLPSELVGLARSVKEVIRAPPFSVGAFVSTVAVPSTPAVIVTIDGAVGGPRGRCQIVVTCVLALHLVRRIIDSGLLLLRQIVSEIIFEPGVPTGANPALYQVELS